VQVFVALMRSVAVRMVVTERMRVLQCRAYPRQDVGDGRIG
jgi:hypothetical protein